MLCCREELSLFLLLLQSRFPEIRQGATSALLLCRRFGNGTKSFALYYRGSG